ncbi:MAG: DUF4160 domain-containing protein [Pseudomonadota bacterium]
MPTISSFYGIIIQMYWREHNPPHFHVKYAEYRAEVNIRTLKLLGGSLPPRAKKMTLEWARLHRAELLADWNLCQSELPPRQIAPLE